MSKRHNNSSVTSIDGKNGMKSKEELLRIVENLSLKVERQKRTIEQQRLIIQYKREKLWNLTNHSLDPEKQITSKRDEPQEIEETKEQGEGALLPLLESMEEEATRKEDHKIRLILRDAFLNKDSKYYTIVNTFLVGLILFSVVGVTLESVPSLMAKWGSFFYWSELIVVSLFTIEYIINIYVANNKLRYIFSIWGLIDLMAILPSYLHLMDLRAIKLARILRIVRFLRTIRIMRILKITKCTAGKYQQSARQRVDTLKLDLQIYGTALFTAVVIFSTLVYYAERNVPNTSFTCIPSAMWWCIVTLATVGYGDMYPSTVIGKIIAAVTVIAGLALFGILANVIGKSMMTSLFGSSRLD